MNERAAHQGASFRQKLENVHLPYVDFASFDCYVNLTNLISLLGTANLIDLKSLAQNEPYQDHKLKPRLK